MPDKPTFELISKERDDRDGWVYIRYGSNSDDPIPFVLAITRQYVASKIGKPLNTLTSSDMMTYTDGHLVELKAMALSQKERGYTTLTLE